VAPRQGSRRRRNAGSDLDMSLAAGHGSASGARLTTRTALARGALRSARALLARRARLATTSASVAGRRPLRCLADTTHQLVRQLRRARLRLAHDVLRTARKGPVRRQRIKTRAGRREEEPSGPHAPSADALAVDCVSGVLESPCKVNDAFRKPMNVCHFFQPLPRNFDCVPHRSRARGPETLPVDRESDGDGDGEAAGDGRTRFFAATLRPLIRGPPGGGKGEK
jgi:hypothetical protein